MKYFYFCLILGFITSCQLKNNSIFEGDLVVDDEISTKMDSIRENKDFTLSTFTKLPSEKKDCYCKFSLTKNAFLNEQYIMIYEPKDSLLFFQEDGNWVNLKSKTFKSNDSLVLETQNDTLLLKFRGLKDSLIKNQQRFKGKINIINQGKAILNAELFGDCGC